MLYEHVGLSDCVEMVLEIGLFYIDQSLHVENHQISRRLYHFAMCSDLTEIQQYITWDQGRIMLRFVMRCIDILSLGHALVFDTMAT